MFKRLETVWNARTPVYLHNGTKENFLFQLMLVLMFLFGYTAWDKYKERRDEKKRERLTVVV